MLHAQKANQRSFFDRLATKLNLTNLDDWYKVSKEVVIKEGGYFVKSRYNGSLLTGKYSSLSQKYIGFNSLRIYSPFPNYYSTFR
jgi:hypothetical protein